MPPVAFATAGAPLVPAAGGDRVHRRLTWLRADLLGQPSEAAEIDTNRTLDLIAEKIESFGGQVESVGANRLVASFGAEPIEDAHRRAALAALAIKKAVDRARQSGVWRRVVSIGIDAHEGIVVPTAERVVIDVDSRRAAEARLAALLVGAPSDSIVVSEAVARLLERRFDVVPLPRAGAVSGRVYRLTGREHAGLGPAGRVMRFVGRRQELELLKARLAVGQAGRGQVVAIIGEAGIGKSRLVFELRHSTADRNDVTFLEGRCQSYASRTPYSPLTEIVRQHCGIAEADAASVVEEKVRRALEAIGLDHDAHAPYLLRLLGVAERTERLGEVGPDLMKARIAEAFRQVVAGASQQRALVLVVEDLHWIDAASDELLTALVDAVTGARLLLVVTYRPGYQASWLARSYVTQVGLPPLSGDESLAVLRAAPHAERVPAELLALIVARADGNPFFLEELVRVIGERDAAETTVAVPETIENVLAARIDRLKPETKRVLQTAAVIGKDVSVALLEAMMTEIDGGLREHLKQLQAAEFLYETRPAPELQYTFKHTLTCEVAYGSVPLPVRRTLHREAARAIVAILPDAAENRPELVARHLSAAEAYVEALPWWLRAGRNAVRRSANVEAISHLRTALELLARLPHTSDRDQQELEMQMTLGPALVMTKGYAAPEVEHVYERARELSVRLGEGPRLFRITRGVWLYHLMRADLRTAHEIGERLVALATKTGDATALAHAHFALGVPLFYRGRLREARAHLEQSLAMHAKAGDGGDGTDPEPDALVASLGFLGWTLGVQGHEAESLHHVEAAVRKARESARVFAYANALHFAGVLHQLRREFAASMAYAERAIAIAREHHFTHVLGEATWVRGWALAAAGRREEGVALMDEGLATVRATGARLAMTYHLGHRAETLAAGGRVQEAWAAVSEGLAAAEQADERLYLPDLHRLRAELLARRGDDDEAERTFRHALALARDEGSRVLVQRVTAALVAYLRARGRGADAEYLLDRVADAEPGCPAA